MLRFMRSTDFNPRATRTAFRDHWYSLIILKTSQQSRKLLK